MRGKYCLDDDEHSLLHSVVTNIFKKNQYFFFTFSPSQSVRIRSMYIYFTIFKASVYFRSQYDDKPHYFTKLFNGGK